MWSSATRIEPRGLSARAALALALILVAMGLGGAPAGAQRATRGDDDSAALVAEGRAALQRGQLAAAAGALDQAIAVNPRRVEAYVLRAAVAAARGQFREGIAIMRRAAALTPDDADVLTALGSQLVLAGGPADLAEGVPLLERVVARNARRYDAQLLLGHHYYARARWAAAVRALEAYFASRPPALASEDAQHRIGLADAYLRGGDPSTARAHFQRAAAQRPGDLRARLGVAWATAAVDCRAARALLQELAATATAPPSAWLVDGRCALALGDPAAAAALGDRYAAAVAGAGGAAGLALVGEAHAARGDLAAARRALLAARARAPGERAWVVRYAGMARRAGAAADAVRALESIGAPVPAASDPAWWRELGDALVATGAPADAVSRLAPALAALPRDGELRAALGAAHLAIGDTAAAQVVLEEAVALGGGARARALLGAALGRAGAAALSAGDAVGAEPVLARAVELAPAPGSWRNLGIARLALARAAEAVAPLELAAARTAPGDGAALASLLAGRARALSGELALARAHYDRAAAVARTPSEVIEVALERAAAEVGAGDPAVAVSALERAAAAARGTGLAARHAEALAAARHAAAVAALREGQAGRAQDLLRAAVAAAPTAARRCDLALAAAAAGDVAAALAAVRGLAGAPCPFPAPADAQAAPILGALAAGLAPGGAARAVARIAALSERARGPAAALAAGALRIAALQAAREAYAARSPRLARRFLARAQAASTTLGADELALGRGVLELELARGGAARAAALAALEGVATRLPEALVHVGIAYEQQGELPRALDAWRRARRAGVKTAALGDWIETLERIEEGAP